MRDHIVIMEDCITKEGVPIVIRYKRIGILDMGQDLQT